ncbi:hypothetical protein [Streptomyces sp. NPDC008121]|uniref:hypothetical protein n=1 Tax=Streptomyces sp. NPDC008121 TaxID=3364809 RepID=UPI0036EF7154
MMQTLAWHVEVEAEDPQSLALLLGMPPQTTVFHASHTPGQLRASLLALHGRLAPRPECRHYTRLLEVSLNRQVSGDVAEHLDLCPYCREARAQFAQPGMLPQLLAEAVMGWGAEEYLRARRSSAARCPAYR